LIAISEENYNTLRDLGKMSDTFDDVISRVLKVVTLSQNKNHVDDDK
jgi:predicted CopG family antitoxin